MGEYATRKSDNKQIKIGTCENMYYLRAEDIDKVQCDYNLRQGGLRFRLPFLDEDHILPGDYTDFLRGVRLWNRKSGNQENFRLIDDSGKHLSPGSIQLTHESGMWLNVPCYHGEKLPDAGECRIFWNGKSWSAELSQLKAVEVSSVEGVRLRFYPIVRCRHCNTCWRCEWAEVWDYIPEDLQARFEQYRD